MHPDDLPPKTQEEINREIHEALFGANGEMGLVAKMDKVWQILGAFEMFGRAVMWCVLFLGAVGAAWATFGGFAKRLLFGK